MTTDEKIKVAHRQLSIDVDQPFQVTYWSRVLDVDEETLRELVRRVGPSADKICAYLGE